MKKSQLRRNFNGIVAKGGFDTSQSSSRRGAFNLWIVVAGILSLLIFSTNAADVLRPASKTSPAGTNIPPVIPPGATAVPATILLTDLRLADYLKEVVRHNDTLQAQLYETEAGRRKAQAERGAFEPRFDVSATREANRRTNNVEQQASENGQSLFNERNNLYEAGLETFLPVGGKIRIGSTVNDLYNNINPYGSLISTTNTFYTKQYETFVGATITQPLLKNAGWAVSLAPLRLAALDSDIAFQQYRRQLMLIVSRAESAYWNLFYAQEQLVFFDESVAVSQGVLDDSRKKLQAGQGSELDIMEAQSGLALRQTKRNEAVQNYFEAAGNLLALIGQSPSLRPNASVADLPPIHVADRPAETNLDLTYQAGIVAALSLNPDYLVLVQKVRQEELRLRVAHNQALPELDLKAAYGYNGIGSSAADSWDSVQTWSMPSWSVGLQLTIPIFGDIKNRNLYHAAQQILLEANSTLRSTQNELSTHLNIIIQKTRAWQQSIQNYQTVVHFNEELLKTQSERLKAGTIDAHKMLEVEADLLDSRQELANALVQYRRLIIEEDLTTGSILKHHDFEITRDQLRHQAASRNND